MKTTFLLLRIQTSKRIVAIFLLFVVLSMWAAADAYAQNKIKYTYDSAGNRLSRQKEIVVQTRGVLSDDEGEPSIYEEKLSETKVRSLRMPEYLSMILPGHCCNNGAVYLSPMR